MGNSPGDLAPIGVREWIWKRYGEHFNATYRDYSNSFVLNFSAKFTEYDKKEKLLDVTELRIDRLGIVRLRDSGEIVGPDQEDIRKEVRRRVERLLNAVETEGKTLILPTRGVGAQ